MNRETDNIYHNQQNVNKIFLMCKHVQKQMLVKFAKRNINSSDIFTDFIAFFQLNHIM